MRSEREKDIVEINIRQIVITNLDDLPLKEIAAIVRALYDPSAGIFIHTSGRYGEYQGVPGIERIVDPPLPGDLFDV